MNRCVLLLIAVMVVAAAADKEIYVSTCARMKTPVVNKVSHGLCITSCKFQNCGTGSCKWRNGRGVCVCSRCGSGGGSWPGK